MPKALHFPERVQGHRVTDAMEPRAERRLTPELADPIEGPDERVLRDVLRQRLVAGNPIGQPIDPVDVRLVQLTLGGGVPVPDPRDQGLCVHRTPVVMGQSALICICGTRCAGNWLQGWPVIGNR